MKFQDVINNHRLEHVTMGYSKYSKIMTSPVNDMLFAVDKTFSKDIRCFKYVVNF